MRGTPATGSAGTRHVRRIAATILVMVSSLLVTVSGSPVAATHVAGTDIVSTVAGNGDFGPSAPLGDGGPATQAALNHPEGVARDAAGNLYIGESYGHRVRRVDATGIITTVAGNGERGYSGDDGQAREAALGFVIDVAVDARGGLYIATVGSVDARPAVVMAWAVRRVDLVSGKIVTVAGNGELGDTGDGGSATSARVDPTAVGVDDAGNLFVAQAKRVRRVSTGGDGVVDGGPNEIITTVAGGGADVLDDGGDGGRRPPHSWLRSPMSCSPATASTWLTTHGCAGSFLVTTT